MNHEENSNNEYYSFNSEEMTVTLQLEEGPVDCAIIVILTIEEMDYIVLLPLDEEGDNDDGEVWFYRYFEDEKDVMADPRLEYIEDDAEVETVTKAFEEYLENAEYDEILDDNDYDEED